MFAVFHRIKDYCNSDDDFKIVFKAGRMTCYCGNLLFCFIMFLSLLIEGDHTKPFAIIFLPLFFTFFAYCISMPFILVATCLFYFIYKHMAKKIPSDIIRFIVLIIFSIPVSYGLCLCVDWLLNENIFSNGFHIIGFAYAFVFVLCLSYQEDKYKSAIENRLASSQ